MVHVTMHSPVPSNAVIATLHHSTNTLCRELGNKLPRFNRTEAADLRGSADFAGINMYTGYAVSKPSVSGQQPPRSTGTLLLASWALEAGLPGSLISALTPLPSVVHS